MRATALAILISLPLSFLCSAVRAGQEPPPTADAIPRFAPRGVVVSRHEATLSSEIVARLLKISVREGDRFAKGDLLFEHDCRVEAAELEAARAEAKSAQLKLQENRELRRFRAAGATELALAAAAFEAAQAKARAIEIRQAQCRFTAPFSGRVVERMANTYETPQANAPLMRIISDRDLEIELVVPSEWLVWLAPGLAFDFQLDETGRNYRARVDNLGAAVDPVSQTVKVKGTFLSATDGILAGMSGSAALSPELAGQEPHKLAAGAQR